MIIVIYQTGIIVFIKHGNTLKVNRPSKKHRSNQANWQMIFQFSQNHKTKPRKTELVQKRRRSSKYHAQYSSLIVMVKVKNLSSNFSSANNEYCNE